MLKYISTLPFGVTVVLVALGAACGCAAILWSLLKTGMAWRLATDIPNDRSLHNVPIPRVGGWGIVPVIVVTTWLLAPGLRYAVLGAAFLAAISQIDDRRGLSARVRFGAHLVAVIGLVALFPTDIPWGFRAIVVFLMLWLVNLYNFMDGADGLAGGMTLIGFAGYAIGASISAHPLPELTLAAAAVAGAAAGFLGFNFHPARVFLGDAGSIPLGFLAGAFGYWGWIRGVWPLWFPALVFSPFIGDASVTLLRRLIRGEAIWKAHREHYYQRMVRYGFGHSKTAVIWYAVMLVGVIVALSSLSWPPAFQWCSVGTWGIVLALMGSVVDSRWRRFNAANS